MCTIICPYQSVQAMEIEENISELTNFHGDITVFHSNPQPPTYTAMEWGIYNV